MERQWATTWIYSKDFAEFLDMLAWRPNIRVLAIVPEYDVGRGGDLVYIRGYNVYADKEADLGSHWSPITPAASTGR